MEKSENGHLVLDGEEVKTVDTKQWFIVDGNGDPLEDFYNLFDDVDDAEEVRRNLRDEMEEAESKEIGRDLTDEEWEEINEDFTAWPRLRRFTRPYIKDFNYNLAGEDDDWSWEEDRDSIFFDYKMEIVKLKNEIERNKNEKEKLPDTLYGYIEQLTKQIDNVPQPTTSEECNEILSILIEHSATLNKTVRQIDILQQNSASLKKTVKQLEEARDKLIK